MMDCDTFLDGYSDFRDGMLAPPERVAFEAHLRDCASCARYDRVVAGGVKVLRDLPELTVADDFMDRLQHRLWHEQDDMAAARARRARGRPGRQAATAAVAAAASVAAVALVPGVYARMAPTVTMLPTAAASAPAQETPYRLAVDDGGAGQGAGLVARLEEVGVEVYPMPYGDVLYHAASTAAVSPYGDVLRHGVAAE
jgi:hypothetical protein